MTLPDIIATIDVTPDHIREGRQSDCGACPIALAIRAAVPSAAEVQATQGWLMFHVVDGEEVRYYAAGTPVVFAVFMEEFDYGRNVTPVSAVVTFGRAS